MVSTRGFSLIEVLVALLVLAIGVLGILVLQLNTLRASRDVALESAALRLATDIAAQVGGSTGSPEMLSAFARFDYTATSAASEAGIACFGADTVCRPMQMASFVMRQWQERIRQALPGGRVRICRDASPWQTATNSVRWDCDNLTDVNTPLTPLWIKIGWRGSQFSATAVPMAPQLVLPVAAFSH